MQDGHKQKKQKFISNIKFRSARESPVFQKSYLRSLVSCKSDDPSTVDVKQTRRLCAEHSVHHGSRQVATVSSSSSGGLQIHGPCGVALGMSRRGFLDLRVRCISVSWGVADGLTNWSLLSDHAAGHIASVLQAVDMCAAMLAAVIMHPRHLPKQLIKIVTPLGALLCGARELYRFWKRKGTSLPKVSGGLTRVWGVSLSGFVAACLQRVWKAADRLVNLAGAASFLSCASTAWRTIHPSSYSLVSGLAGLLAVQSEYRSLARDVRAGRHVPGPALEREWQLRHTWAARHLAHLLTDLPSSPPLKPLMDLLAALSVHVGGAEGRSHHQSRTDIQEKEKNFFQPYTQLAVSFAPSRLRRKATRPHDKPAELANLAKHVTSALERCVKLWSVKPAQQQNSQDPLVEASKPAQSLDTGHMQAEKQKATLPSSSMSSTSSTPSSPSVPSVYFSLPALAVSLDKVTDRRAVASPLTQTVSAEKVIDRQAVPSSSSQTVSAESQAGISASQLVSPRAEGTRHCNGTSSTSGCSGQIQKGNEANLIPGLFANSWRYLLDHLLSAEMMGHRSRHSALNISKQRRSPSLTHITNAKDASTVPECIDSKCSVPNPLTQSNVSMASSTVLEARHPWCSASSSAELVESVFPGMLDQLEATRLFGRGNHSMPLVPGTNSKFLWALELAGRAAFLMCVFLPFLTVGLLLLGLSSWLYREGDRTNEHVTGDPTAVKPLQENLSLSETPNTTTGKNKKSLKKLGSERQTVSEILSAATDSESQQCEEGLVPKHLMTRLGIFQDSVASQASLLAWQLLLQGCRMAGPAFIKWGQWSASRPDIFPPGMCDTLAELHDRAPMHSAAVSRAVIQRALGRSAGSMFDAFEAEPLASGSIAQVHRANLCLANGALLPVAVKVRHPNVARRLAQDFTLLTLLASLVGRLPALRHLGLAESVSQFSAGMSAQADLRVEALHLARFAANFQHTTDVSIPLPLPGYVSEEVLVETFEAGASLTQYIKTPSPLNKTVTSIGVDAYLQMLLVDSLVHGDMHPGNLMVRLVDREGRLVSAKPLPGGEVRAVGSGHNAAIAPTAQIVLLDFGIVEEVDPEVRHHFISFLHHLCAGNGRAATQHLLHWGHPQHCPDPAALEADMGRLFKEQCNIYSEEGVQLDNAMKGVMALARRHAVTVSSRYASLVISLVVVVGLAQGLDPSVRLADAAVPALLSHALTGQVLGRMYG